jgi:predicted  nucleic acid-binding Zn-ribbon protein
MAGQERGKRLKQELALLIELQKTELSAGRIIAKKKELPDRMSRLEEEFNACLAAVEKEREKLETLRKGKREKDAHLQKGQDTLKRSRERLFEVKTNKEYQSVLKEIEILEEKNSGMEDEIISLLDELDRLETSLKKQEVELDARRLRHEEEKRKATEELDALARDLDVCIRKSGEMKKNIPADILRKYEQIKNIRRGVAVVAVWKEICDGCHMSIPPQLYNQLQKAATLITCPNCNRIIYWEQRDL